MKVYMETVLVNNTKYDVLVEEEDRLVRLLFIISQLFSDKYKKHHCFLTNMKFYKQRLNFS